MDQGSKRAIQAAQPIEWTDSGVVVLDQRLLPEHEVRNTYTDYQHVARAIRDMEIRGAPAIGVAAAMGAAIGVLRSEARTLEELRAEFDAICGELAQTRPTAVDLFWAITRMRRVFAEACQTAAANGNTARTPTHLEALGLPARHRTNIFLRAGTLLLAAASFLALGHLHRLIHVAYAA